MSSSRSELPADLQAWLERTAAKWGVSTGEVIRVLGLDGLTTQPAEAAPETREPRGVQPVSYQKLTPVQLRRKSTGSFT